MRNKKDNGAKNKENIKYWAFVFPLCPAPLSYRSASHFIRKGEIKGTGRTCLRSRFLCGEEFQKFKPKKHSSALPFRFSTSPSAAPDSAAVMIFSRCERRTAAHVLRNCKRQTLELVSCIRIERRSCTQQNHSAASLPTGIAIMWRTQRKFAHFQRIATARLFSVLLPPDRRSMLSPVPRAVFFLNDQRDSIKALRRLKISRTAASRRPRPNASP